MNEQLSELQNIASAARNKKTNRMDAQTRSRAAELLASIWSTSEDLAEETVSLFDDLQSEAVADAVSRMWPELSEERRALFKNRIYKPTTERTTRRLALFVAAVIKVDGPTALAWLQILLPRDKQVVSKDVKQSISSALFSSPPPPFESLSAPSENSYEVSRIYATLWDIAKTAEPRAPLMARAKLAMAFARFSFANKQKSNAATQFLADLEEERRNWPTDLQNMLDKELHHDSTKTPATGTASEFTRTAPSHSNIEQTTEEQTTYSKDETVPDAGNRQLAATAPQSVESQSPPVQGDAASQHVGLLGQLTDNANNDLRSFAALGQIIRNLFNRKESLNADLQLARTRLEAKEGELRSTLAEQKQRTMQNDETVSRLKSDLHHIEDRLQSTLHQLTEARTEATREATRLRTQMGQSTAAWENERGLLAQQIGANAAGRVDEFRRRLGGVLSRLAQDLPHKDAPMSPELGSAVLLLFHQFVDALQEQGIPVTIRKNGQ